MNMVGCQIGLSGSGSQAICQELPIGVQSRQGEICRSRLLTVTTTLRQQGRDVWQFLEQAWIAHHRGGVMPSLLPDP
jgi:transposase